MHYFPFARVTAKTQLPMSRAQKRNILEKIGLILAFEFIRAIHNLHKRLFSLDSPSGCGNESAAILAANQLTHYTLIFIAIVSKKLQRNKND